VAALTLSGCAEQVAGQALPVPWTVIVTTQNTPPRPTTTTTTPPVPLTTVNRANPATDKLCNLISVPTLVGAMEDSKLPTIAHCEARAPEPGGQIAFGHWTFEPNTLGSSVASVEIEVYDDINSDDGSSRFARLKETFPNIKSGYYIRNLPAKYDAGAGVTFVQIPDGGGGATDLSMTTGLVNGESPGSNSLAALGVQNQESDAIGALLPTIFPGYPFAK